MLEYLPGAEYPAMPTLQPEASGPPAAAAGQPKYPHSSQTFPHQIYNSDPTSQERVNSTKYQICPI